MTRSRRDFIRIVPAFGAFAISVPAVARDQGGLAAVPAWPTPAPARGFPVDESFPSQHPALVKEMVAVSHFNLGRVRELVQQHPELAKASWDWGYGDWETALGAASHVGNRPIAELLLELGAPPTIFSATMLGQLDVVKACVAASPGLQRLRGPHGLTMMVHARAGGAPASAVLNYLESLGNAGLPYRDDPMPSDERAALEGRYTFGDRPRDGFIVRIDKSQLLMTRIGATERTLFHQGALAFHAAGAPGVKIRFEREGANIAALTVWDPDPVVRARRSG